MQHALGITEAAAQTTVSSCAGIVGEKLEALHEECITLASSTKTLAQLAEGELRERLLLSLKNNQGWIPNPASLASLQDALGEVPACEAVKTSVNEVQRSLSDLRRKLGLVKSNWTLYGKFLTPLLENDLARFIGDLGERPSSAEECAKHAKSLRVLADKAAEALRISEMQRLLTRACSAYETFSVTVKDSLIPNVSEKDKKELQDFVAAPGQQRSQVFENLLASFKQDAAEEQDKKIDLVSQSLKHWQYFRKCLQSLRWEKIPESIQKVLRHNAKDVTEFLQDLDNPKQPGQMCHKLLRLLSTFVDA